jgi:hyperosmotically inducible protein
MKFMPSLGLIASAVCLLAGCSKPGSDTVMSSAPDNQTNNPTPTYRDATAAPRTYSTNDTNANTSAASTAEPDNTGKNVRDRSDATLTPGDQGGSESDRQLTRQVRRAITSNDQLSTTAKNIKIITVNGKVTLRGPVNSEQEKQTIDAAVKQAGVASFDDQLEVKAANQ